MTDEEKKAKQREYSRANYLRNKAKRNAAAKAWRAANVERAREITRECEKRRAAAKAIEEGREPGRIGRPPQFTAEEKRAKRNAKAKHWYREADVALTDAYREKARLREQEKRDGTFVSNALPRLTDEERKIRDRKDFAKRRARIQANGGSFTKDDIIRLMAEQEGKCALCGLQFGDDGYHIDHFVPLSRGGSNDASNLKLTHPVCNLKKGARLLSALVVKETP